MGRSFKHNKYDDEQDTILDDSELTTGLPVSANGDATGSLSVNRRLSSKARKKANKELRKQRRHDERQ